MPFAPTYYPTEAEFAQPFEYMARIRPEAQRFGLCKIVPPPSCRHAFELDYDRLRFKTKLQRIDCLLKRETKAEAQARKDRDEAAKMQTKLERQVNRRLSNMSNQTHYMTRRSSPRSTQETNDSTELSVNQSHSNNSADALIDGDSMIDETDSKLDDDFLSLPIDQHFGGRQMLIQSIDAFLDRQPVQDGKRVRLPVRFRFNDHLIDIYQLFRLCVDKHGVDNVERNQLWQSHVAADLQLPPAENVNNQGQTSGEALQEFWMRYLRDYYLDWVDSQVRAMAGDLDDQQADGSMEDHAESSAPEVIDDDLSLSIISSRRQREVKIPSRFEFTQQHGYNVTHVTNASKKRGRPKSQSNTKSANTGDANDGSQGLPWHLLQCHTCKGPRSRRPHAALRRM